MYLWLLEMIQPQCRHEREIKAESDVPNPLLRGLENAELFSCFVSLSACVIFGVLLFFFCLVFFGVYIPVFTWSELSLFPF